MYILYIFRACMVAGLVLTVNLSAYAAPDPVMDLTAEQIGPDLAQVCFTQPAPGSGYSFTENVVVVSLDPFNTRVISRDRSPDLSAFRAYAIPGGELSFSNLQPPGTELCQTTNVMVDGTSYYIGHIGRDTCLNARRRCDMSRIAQILFVMDDFSPIHTISLAWDVVNDARVKRYEIHYGSHSGQYDEVVIAYGAGQFTDYVLIEGLYPGVYTFAVRACGESLCSDFSNEVEANVGFN